MLVAFGSAACAQQQIAAYQSYMPKLTPEMLSYCHIQYFLYFIDFLFTILFCCLFLQIGLADKLRQFAQSQTKSFFIQLAIFVLVFYAAFWLSGLPLRYYQGYWLPHHYALSDQSIFSWTVYCSKFFVVGTALKIIGLFIIYATVRRFRRTWPLLVFALSVPAILLFNFAIPIVLAPIYDKYTPLSPGPLRTKIEALTARAHLNNVTIMVCERSRRTNEINAHVSGIGSSSQIVLWDTAIKRLPEEQLLAQVAHEIGHYALKHTLKQCAFWILISLLFVPINFLVTPHLFEKLPGRWGIKSLEDLAGIPFLACLLALGNFAMAPVVNGLSRYQEHEADVYALKLLADRTAFVRLIASLSMADLREPDPPPFIEFWLFDHPSAKHRIEYALESK